MSTPPKFPNTELDTTLLCTPMPKASSTVQRKSTLEKKYLDMKFMEENFVKPSLYGTNMLLKSDDSSLGILNNISSLLEETSGINYKMKEESNKLDAEQELARKLLRKCSNIKGSISSSDSNKEDDVNMETIRDYVHSSDQVDGNSFKYNIDNKSEQQDTLHPKYSSSVVFKLDEITARSSEMSKNEKLESFFSPKSARGISFDTVIAEQQAVQFKDEEFYSISQINSHLLADEPSWKQNYTYNSPLATNSEKEYLNLSCFSGIIGDADVSVESSIGRKISIGEFFKRKSESTGNLSNSITERPPLGIPIKSPKKKRQLIPLVDSTIVDGSSTFREKEQILTNVTQNIEEHSIMSLSSIAQALQDLDNCTPRRLVDQLIMAKKKRKELERNNDQGNTYMLSSSDRRSMPVTPSAIKTKDDNISSKLSLDSKTINETLETKQTLPRMLTFTSNLDLHTKNILEDIPQIISLKKEEESSMNLQQQLDTDEIQLVDMQSILKDNKLSLSKINSDKSVMERKESFKKENISYTSKADCSVQQLSTVERSSLGTSQLQDIILSKNGQEICCCIVGMSREADIELTNTGDKWIICLFNTYQLQGDKQNLILHLPQDKILIKPNSTRSVKIGVKVTKKTNPVIVILNIITTDMVTGKELIIKHMIYVESEELQVNVLTPHEELDFGSILENTIKTLSITLQNKNNMILPITLSVVHDGPKIFSINNLQGDLTHELKPREQFTAVVQCEGTSSLLTSELSQNQLVNVEAKLLIQVNNKKDDAVMIKEIPLFVKIAQCKIQLVDTELPIEISKKKMKHFTIINLGKLPILITASIVQDEYSSHHVEDFSIKPESLMLQRNATDKFLITFKPRQNDIRDRHVKIKLTAGNNTYYYSLIGKQNIPIEIEHENHLRCETPQQLYNAISPNSPQSIHSSRSGRNSPISSVSGSTVAGDQIPIKSTHAALVWGSIKPNKSNIKEFTIRNMSENRIKLQVHIFDNNNSFLFLKDHQTTSPNIVLLLHRMESKTLSVIFCPRHIGAATGKIVFSHYEIKKEENNKSRPTKAISLYGYGGFGRVIISNVVKDIGEKMWLPLGKLSSGGILNANIKLENVGDLCSYAKVKLTPKAIYPSMLSSWQINPTELLLEPKETQWITLEFQPKKEDLVLLRQCSNVCHVGTINIIYGDEPTRWRIRRLYSKIKSASDLNGGESEPFRNIVYPLCKIFPGEQMMSDLNLINDSIHNLSDLCHGVRQHEIMLTVETNADESLSMMHDSADESQIFYSLCSDNSHIYESSGKSFLPLETIIGGNEINECQQKYDDYFTVSPDVVSLIPSIKNEAIVTILSSNRVAQPYETVLSNTDVLSILPAEGMIPAGKGFPLRIKCKQKVQRSLEATLKIYTENHRRDVKIKVAVVH
ncbi:uncharacterized protein LOC122519426 isoform X1 [Polistes fuscatus]|uniref:uncharacterized protein LOC122519426 isoform X1 n=1 Tax=Polistes fuscatus TaxID=30207 RepID=UPI001CA8A673|nr:uncharacterized protein LOC122519426 isoform X1 [Polistes fuscatus]XP_043494772.1 uncharacterized protein LOC122519426 isoform X1 [Polistes fuscatus]